MQGAKTHGYEHMQGMKTQSECRACDLGNVLIDAK